MTLFAALDFVSAQGLLAVVVGVAVLMGSVFLILSTNLGSRLGFLVSLTILSGWMFVMGITWALYGIGWKGSEPSWKVTEVVEGRIAKAENADVRSLKGWKKATEEDKVYGDAVAAAEPALKGEESRWKQYGTTDQLIPVAVYQSGGANLVPLIGAEGCEKLFIVPCKHETSYAVVQLQRAKDVEVPLGEKPPTPVVDPTEPVYSVIEVRDIGNRRLRPVLFTIASFLIFAVSAHRLHERDKLAMARTAA